MERIETALPGAFLIRPEPVEDLRGCLVKTVHAPTLKTWGIDFAQREEFFSVSHRNVLRGMHFQMPPHAHDKLVYCIQGEVLDVILDLRRYSPTYGECHACELNEVNRLIVYAPQGIAHGFLSRQDDTIMVYKTNHEYVSASDRGILWNSFGFDWPASDPILSDRDRSHPPLAAFTSPF